MTFKDQLKTDLAVFTNPDEFGETAIYSKTGTEVNVLLDKEQEQETGRIIDVLTVSKLDVPNLLKNETFTVGTDVWRVVVTEPLEVGEFMMMVRVENESV